MGFLFLFLRFSFWGDEGRRREWKSLDRFILLFKTRSHPTIMESRPFPFISCSLGRTGWIYPFLQALWMRYGGQ